MTSKTDTFTLELQRMDNRGWCLALWLGNIRVMALDSEQLKGLGELCGRLTDMQAYHIRTGIQLADMGSLPDGLPQEVASKPSRKPGDGKS
jgi:hypothetical protein